MNNYSRRAAQTLLLAATTLVLAACGTPREQSTPGADDGGSEGPPVMDAGAQPPHVVALPSAQAYRPRSSFSFVVFGDTQPQDNYCEPELTAFPRVILALKPDFVLHLGDLMDRGREPRAYQIFAHCYKELLDRLPLFPTVGNHDLDWYLGAGHYRSYLVKQLFSFNPAAFGGWYQAAFGVVFGDDTTDYSTNPDSPDHTHTLPSGVSYKTFYAFRYGSAYFLSFEQGAALEINTPRTWVEKHLKLARADPSIRFIFVLMHHPMYSTLMDELYLIRVRAAYEPLFRKYDVTLVLAGHAHAYDRFHVPDDDRRSATSFPPSRYRLGGKAVHYLVSGPAGASYLPGGCDPMPAALKTPTDGYPQVSASYSQARGCGHNLVRIKVHKARATVDVISVSGDSHNHKTALWDRFELLP